MKKRLVAVLIVVVMCLAALSGCSLIKGLERDVQVILMGVQQTESGDLVTNDDGSYQYEYVGTYTVNQFNNAIVPEPDYAPDGMQFAGWSPIKDWTEDDGIESVSSSKGLIRYDDVKNFVDGESLSITLYAAFAPIPQHDLVIAWYDKESTSGINQAWMDQFQTNLYAFLTTEGYTPESMDIIIRGYSGNVGPSCSEIMDDGDVDIMYGWGGNIDSTGGMVEGVDYLENVSGIEINGKNRYAARLTNKPLVNLVYNWILGRDETPTPEPEPEPEPTPDPDPDTQTQLTVGWYAKSGTSGLDQTIISVFTRGLNAYLAANNYSDVEVIVRAYDGNVADVETAVTTDGDVDVMIGMKAFSVEGIIEQQDDVPMGEKTDRRVHLLDEGEVSKAVYEWLKTDDARALLLTPAAQTQLVIGWYAKSGTSGLDQTIIDTFTAGLNAYLETQGYTSANLTVVFRAYDGKVDEVISAVDTDGDVDIMVGMKAFDYEGVLEVQEDVPMGEKTDRRVHLLDDDAVSLLVFDWLKTDEARALFAATATTALAA
ncbi:MAG TPA: hypothetical protein IAB25_02315 [Candidatus Coproplasma stercoravium]|nr:hypothetical protein [Candidatus Coproplasma stercoravium]